MRYRCAALVFCATLGSATVVIGQAPGPKEDETPLARPEPLCTVSAPDPRILLNRVRQAVEHEGYTISRTSGVAGELEAVKPDGPNSDDYDRVIIWVERDLNRPQDALKLFVLAGRYEKVWGNTLSVRRIRLDPAKEATRIGPLRKRLVALVEGGG